MKLHFWGTRGSLPRAITDHLFRDLLEETLKKAEKSGLSTLAQFRESIQKDTLFQPLSYGGNTSSYEIRGARQSIFVDMGSGLAEASTEILKSGQSDHCIFLTHMHWDHLMGLPFFSPIYAKEHRIKIYHVHPHAPDSVRNLFNGVNFPVLWKNLAAEIEFVPMKLHDKIELEPDFQVSSFALDHPGGCFGYRFESKGQSLAIGVDGEFKRRSQKELGKDLSYYQNLDLLVFDGQYEEAELSSHFDWGHSTPSVGVDIALREGIRNLIITHHDPRGSETRARSMLTAAIEHRDLHLDSFKDVWLKQSQIQGPNIYLAFDGLQFDLDKPQKHSGKLLDT